MRIALLGGTGDIGAGLALRWATDSDHDIVIGSRDPEKARETAAAYEDTLADQGVDRKLTGFANEMAADRADVVVVAVPAYHVTDVMGAVADRLDADTLVISPAVGIASGEHGLHYNPPSAGSVTALVADAAPDGVDVVGAFHNLAADRLADLDTELDADTLVVGDDEGARTRVAALADDITGLRALDAGPVENAAEVESLTPLLINLARYNDDLRDVGVTFE
ncbi:NADPH-dependent F420 reductase [Halobacterium salinarum]|uniref:NADPH-dependent F420 reductase n=1 Tax=Halobacterium salinarum TaxID=2242 RepID=UPI002552BB05|nr:NADPH-dependent F420 reductase [Halobacterium salinarum]MDL0124804.1 NADPH-dependent F420 reductase [Halobacterium salinarum]